MDWNVKIYRQHIRFWQQSKCGLKQWKTKGLCCVCQRSHNNSGTDLQLRQVAISPSNSSWHSNMISGPEWLNPKWRQTTEYEVDSSSIFFWVPGRPLRITLSATCQDASRLPAKPRAAPPPRLRSVTRCDAPLHHGKSSASQRLAVWATLWCEHVYARGWIRTHRDVVPSSSSENEKKKKKRGSTGGVLVVLLLWKGIKMIHSVALFASLINSKKENKQAYIIFILKASVERIHKGCEAALNMEIKLTSE